MVTLIETRKSLWYGRLAFAILLPAVNVFYIYEGFWRKATFAPVIIMAAIVWYYVSVMLEMLFIPKSAILDTDAKQIEAQYFFKKKIIYLDEIDSLSTNSISTRYKQTGTDYQGIMIYLKSGEKVLFSDLYMADQSDIYSYLKTAGIRDNGEETFKKFSYYLDSYMMRKKAI